MKWTKWKIFRLIWVAAGIGFSIWMWFSYQSSGVDKRLFDSNAQLVVVNSKNHISFTPVADYEQVFIFYPGAMVDPDAYVPLCRGIADNGHKVLLIKMPWRLAVKGYNLPKELGLFDDHKKQYTLAGHSQGAKMAAQFVHENPGLVDKLILIGTTHPRDIDMSGIDIPVLKIYGSRDGVAAPEDVNRNKPMLPSTAKYVFIEGANHSQFGYYGLQLGDDKAGITRALQQQIVLKNILLFIKP